MTHRTTKSYYSILQKYKFRLFQAYQFVAYLQHPLACRIHIVNHTHRFRLFGIDDISPFRFIAVISENISVSEQHALVAAYFLPRADAFGNCRPVGSSPVIKQNTRGAPQSVPRTPLPPFILLLSARSKLVPSETIIYNDQFHTFFRTRSKVPSFFRGFLPFSNDTNMRYSHTYPAILSRIPPRLPPEFVILPELDCKRGIFFNHFLSFPALQQSFVIAAFFINSPLRRRRIFHR